MSYRGPASKLFREIQDEICQALVEVDGLETFQQDQWQRQESGNFDGGGGLTRVLSSGAVFEKAGVNFSEVYGSLPEAMVATLVGESSDCSFYATGVSLVVHPDSPLVPTVHANFRYLEVANRCWFGGGADLTPYYLFEEDAVHFHSVWRDVCGEDIYRKAKKSCDEYFYLPHRQEARGIGGIFYDYLGRDDPQKLDDYFDLTSRLGKAFVPSYVPIVARRRQDEWTKEQKHFQLLRRGRYVEFNLLHDRGTQFGIKTNGRTESILMSLPPEVRWEYCFKPEQGSPEADLLKVLQTPKDWI